MSVGQLAAEFPDLVPSGISKHLMSLRAAGLVSAERQGRSQIYRLEPDALVADLTPWIAKYEQYWSAALERLRHVAQESATKPGTHFPEDFPTRKVELRYGLVASAFIGLPWPKKRAGRMAP